MSRNYEIGTGQLESTYKQKMTEKSKKLCSNPNSLGLCGKDAEGTITRYGT
jgi:hypothetical protein